jgi:hypothetical protein
MTSDDDQSPPEELPGFTLAAAVEVTEHNIRTALDSIEHSIQEKGWTMVGSSMEADCDGDGDFSYTLGLHKRRLPEIITGGLCGCSHTVIGTLAERQLKAGAFEDGQITQIHGVIVQLERWPHTAHLRLLNRYYQHFSDLPELLLARPA